MKIMVSAALALSGLALATVANSQEATAARSALLDDFLACRTITAESERLACFDSTAGAFETAEQQGQVAVIDRAQASQTRQRLFGLSLDGAALFGNLREDAPVDAIQTTLASARQAGRGGWAFDLADGSTWRQVDDERLNARPVPGATVRVRQAALGSYLLSIDGARSVRVRRER